MRFPKALLPLLALIVIPAGLSASVRDVQVFGIVERVVFEPNEKDPKRIKVYGAFALLYTAQDPVLKEGSPYSPTKGFLYFKLPEADRSDIEKQLQAAAKKEWADLKAVAGTGQAISFGSWSSAYLGTSRNTRVNGFVSVDGDHSLRVYSASERGADAIPYTMDSGIVKIQSQSRYATLIPLLEKTLKQ